MSKYGFISGPYYPLFGRKITPYLDTFHAVLVYLTSLNHGVKRCGCFHE